MEGLLTNAFETNAAMRIAAILHPSLCTNLCQPRSIDPTSQETLAADDDAAGRRNAQADALLLPPHPNFAHKGEAQRALCMVGDKHGALSTRAQNPASIEKGSAYTSSAAAPNIIRDRRLRFAHVLGQYTMSAARNAQKSVHTVVYYKSHALGHI